MLCVILLALWGAIPIFSYEELSGTIAFNSVGTAEYAFDVFVDTVHLPVLNGDHLVLKNTSCQTDGVSRNYNAVQSFHNDSLWAFVSERDGNMEIYLAAGHSVHRITQTSALEDRATFSPDERYMAFVSTRQNSLISRKPWNAIYLQDLSHSPVFPEPTRLTPKTESDFSPSFSPNGRWIAYAQVRNPTRRSPSDQVYDIGIMDAKDGSKRKLIALDGGWPVWKPDSSGIYFHAQDEKGVWAIFLVEIIFSLDDVLLSISSPKRVSPPGVHAMTPSSFQQCPEWLVVAVRESPNSMRKTALLDITKQQLFIVPDQLEHKYNPFGIQCFAKGESLIEFRYLYHKCQPSTHLNVESVTVDKSVSTNLALVRTAGSYPAFSPDGSTIAFTPYFNGVDLMDLDGSKRRNIYRNKAFHVSWSSTGHLITSQGGVFQPPEADVKLIRMDTDGNQQLRVSHAFKGNNAFGSFSPDGERIVFRSGTSGVKHLYIADSDGDNPKQLTFGDHTDTMPNWSPDGKTIAFSRELGGNFSLWTISPDGKNSKELFADHGRATHPWFSPDSKWIVFASDFAGCSAEIISVPFQFQPYGEIFIMRAENGSDLQRLTHNSNEDGTPSWGKTKLETASSEGYPSTCSFSDVHLGAVSHRAIHACPMMLSQNIHGFDNDESICPVPNGNHFISAVILGILSTAAVLTALLRYTRHRTLGYTEIN